MEFIGGGVPVPVKHAREIKTRLIEQIIDYYLIIEYRENKITSLSLEKRIPKGI